MVGFALAIVSLPLPAQQILGHLPLCEASAAVILPCPGAQGDCLVVGDNEVKDQLFSFPIRNGAVMVDEQGDLEFPGGGANEVADIEALVALNNGELLVWGSHSRNSTCEAKDKRRRFMILNPGNERPTVARTVASGPIDCVVILGTVIDNDPVANSVCETIAEAERRADQLAGLGSKVDCEKLAPFNAEGAMSLPGSAKSEVWIGLRAPLFATHPKDSQRRGLAILLRLKDLKAFTADRIALLDLEGRGVRDLVYDRGDVWVIAGPSDDRGEPFQLRHFPAGALADNAIIDTTLVRDLPSSAEGLAILGHQAFVVIDGEEPENDQHSCQKSAGLFVFDLQPTRKR
jgi:hypothetical protein